MITLKNITKYYTRGTRRFTALDNINLNIKRGEIFGIIGKSGAGKSTLIRCINLLERPDSGEVHINNVSLMPLSETKLRHARRQTGMIFQHFNLLNARNVRDNVALPLEIAGISRHAARQKIAPLLELTGLTGRETHYPAQLSGGQKQRVAIARALAAEPTVLLSDEATSALDPETTQSILELLKNIRDTLNITILLITHEMAVIKACCDRVGILENGKLIEENEVGEFFAHPKTSTAKKFIVSSLPQHLPTILTASIQPTPTVHTHPIMRLWFFGNAATQPIIAQLINQFQLRVNILQANVEYIKKHAMGVMILAMDGAKDRLDAAITYLQQTGIHVEVLGYVPDNLVSFV